MYAVPPDSALALAQRLAARELTAEALATTSLARIDAVNEQLQAFVAVFRKTATRAAKRYDAARASGAKLPFFAGVPLAVKDQNFMRGHTARFGSAAGLAFPSPFDDVIVSRLRKAGFVLMGATSLSEFGSIAVTENLLHPPARNPWKPSHTPGGSSGGSGAAVAAGLVPIAHGADGGGSLRIPAAFCGLFTMKPTRGVLPNNHGYDAQRSLYTDGPLATTTLDVAAMLDVMIGRQGPSEWTEAARQAPRSLKIRVWTGSDSATTDPRLIAATKRVGDELAKLGHHVEAATPLQLTPAQFVPLWQRLLANTPFFTVKKAHPITAWLFTEGKKLNREAIWQQHLAAQAAIDAWFGEADIVISPTTAIVPQPIGLGAPGSNPRADFERFVPFAVYTAPFNVSGQPAASVPVGLTDDGLPMGVQLVGKRGTDALVLSLSQQLEEAGVALHLRSPMR